MHHVIVCGDCGERQLTKMLVSACTHYGGVVAANGGYILQTAKEPAFLLLSVNSLKALDCSGLLILGEALCQVPAAVRMKNVLSIADSTNRDAVKFLQGTGKAMIGCSMSDKDTVTLSERNETGGLFCLQRTVTTLGGRVIDPCEIAVSAEAAVPVFPLLAACCVLLLCDVPYQDGYDLTGKDSLEMMPSS